MQLTFTHQSETETERGASVGDAASSSLRGRGTQRERIGQRSILDGEGGKTERINLLMTT
ncbi:hypothetical protein F7725_027272 [Dissostichus mawsoni]|uniref:Uncharacterized protein n=1 Tax=Dissostichus mawsoni TaxID=36200 RepID=A0A7J5XCI3_DISMA|nr:hypothetical protein F7725_027272 [Dissostichus mawsoni]